MFYQREIFDSIYEIYMSYSQRCHLKLYLGIDEKDNVSFLSEKWWILTVIFSLSWCINSINYKVSKNHGSAPRPVASAFWNTLFENIYLFPGKLYFFYFEKLIFFPSNVRLMILRNSKEKEVLAICDSKIFSNIFFYSLSQISPF